VLLVENLSHVHDASRTSGERRATIMVGDAMSGAACMAVSLLAVIYLTGGLEATYHTMLRCRRNRSSRPVDMSAWPGFK
jgi:hypothetical protein